MTLADAPSSSRSDRLSTVAGLAAIFVLMWVLSTWVGGVAQNATLDALWVLLTSLPMALVWVAAALGFGWPLQRLLVRDATHPLALQIGLGVAAMLMLDAALGALGWLTVRIVAWSVSAMGVMLLGAQVLPRLRTARTIPLPHWHVWASAPAIAVLLLAACSAPGWLWASEFGGYDALSYHLQLPKEWLALGRMQPLEHNVYSFLPGYVEAAYLHLMSLRGGAPDALAALYDCQMLHAVLTLLSASMVGVLVARVGGGSLGAAAAALYLVTPWVIIVGSLAYNEMAVNLLFAAGLLMAFDERITPARRGIVIGLLSAGAGGAKLTSIGFVALPLVGLMIVRWPWRVWLPAIMCAAIVGIIGLLPYFIRNAAHAGNPVFPFTTGIFGLGHWNVEQAIIFRHGHMPDVSLALRVNTLWHQFLAYGFGPAPAPGVPWKPQWSVLPWLGLLGATIALFRPALTWTTIGLLVVLALQIVFWLFFTHLQSRFLLPVAPVLCVLTMLGVRAAIGDQPSRARSQAISVILTLALLAMSALPVFIYRGEGNGSPALAIGTVGQQTGDEMDESDRRELGSSVFPAIAVNYLLPENSKVLLVGEAAPLYMRLDRFVYNTVWDRGPLSGIMREHPDDPEQWRAGLRAVGFTHVLVNPTMLTIWQSSGWNDPLVARPSVLGFLETTAEPIYDYPKPSEITIYALPE